MAVREKTLADLDDARRRLSGIEENSRELADKLQSLRAAADQLPAEKTAEDKRTELRHRLADLNAEHSKLNQNLKAASAAASQKKLVFSIVPFDGVYKTNRRPIYIECRSDVIVLQPEGIVFTPADFLGPGGPGNPLASALRAAQEYWRNVPSPTPDVPNEPYPLLIVRPDGVIAYYLARDAMESWNTEFGYELVNGDAKFDFPNKPEQRLVEMEQRAVAEARQRLQWLAQVSPEAFDRKQQKVQYRVSAIRGGLVRDGGPSLGNDPFADDPLGGFGKSATMAGGGDGNAGPGGTGSDGAERGGGFAPGGNGPGGGTGEANGSNGSGGNSLAGTRGNSAFGNGTGNSGYGTGGPGGPGLGGGGLANDGMNWAGTGTGAAVGMGGSGSPYGAGGNGMGATGIGLPADPGNSTVAGYGGESNSGGFKNGTSGYMTGASGQGQGGYDAAASGTDGQNGQPLPLGPRYSQSGSQLGSGPSGGGQLGDGQLGGGQLGSGQPGGQYGVANDGSTPGNSRTGSQFNPTTASGSNVAGSAAPGTFAAGVQGNPAGMYGRSAAAPGGSTSGNSNFGDTFASSGGSMDSSDSKFQRRPWRRQRLAECRLQQPIGRIVRHHRRPKLVFIGHSIAVAQLFSQRRSIETLA